MRSARITARTTLAAIALCVPLLASCSGSDSPGAAASPSPSPTAATQLLAGKGDQALTPGQYISPEGFAPALLVTLAGEWNTSHRESDAFDLSRPDAGADAPLVAVVLMKVTEKTPDAALKAIRDRAKKGIKVDVKRTLLGKEAKGLEITGGGSAGIIRSTKGSIELDGQTHGVVRAYAVDTGSGVLLAVSYVPAVTKDSTVTPDVDALLSSVTLQD